MDSVYTGLDSQGMATVQIQLTGGRLVIFVAVDELIAFFPDCHGVLKDAIDMFAALDAKNNLPDSFAMPSLSTVYLKTGDVVYCPLGFVCFEKTISELGLTVRTVHVMPNRTVPAANHVKLFHDHQNINTHAAQTGHICYLPLIYGLQD